MKIVLFNLCFFSALIGYSQDIIVKLNGDTVLAQVLEVQLTDIVYQTPTVPASEKKKINLLNVKEIVYSDGLREVYGSKRAHLVTKSGDTLTVDVVDFQAQDIIYKNIGSRVPLRRISLERVDKVVFEGIRTVEFDKLQDDKIVLKNERARAIYGEIVYVEEYDIYIRKYENAQDKKVPIYKIDKVIYKDSTVVEYTSMAYKDPRTGEVRYYQKGLDRRKRNEKGSFAFNKEQRNTLYTRIGVYELSLGYQARINEKLGWGVEADYRPAFKSSSRNNMQFMSWSLALEGYRVKSMINYYHKDHSYMSFVLSYRFLEAQKLIYDPGYFGGSNTSDYAVYSQKNHEFGLSFLYNKSFRQSKMEKAKSPHEWYFGAGLVGKSVERHYSIEGYYSGQTPSDKVTHPLYFTPVIYLGIKLKVARF